MVRLRRTGDGSDVCSTLKFDSQEGSGEGVGFNNSVAGSRPGKPEGRRAKYDDVILGNVEG